MNTEAQTTTKQPSHMIVSKADLHLHTVHSDGNATVAALLEHVATKTDLRVIAITDHDTISGAVEAQTMAASYGLEVIVGEEVSTLDGHLLALFIERPLPPGRPAAQSIAAIHAQGGLAIAAHPYDWMVPSMGLRGLHQYVGQAEAEWPLDGIESFNAGVVLPNMNRRAQVAARALALPTLGGSDSHQLATVGCSYTLFPGQTASELRAAIHQRQVQAAGRYWGWRATAEATWFVLQRALQNRVRRLTSAGTSPHPLSSSLPFSAIRQFADHPGENEPMKRIKTIPIEQTE